MTPGIPKLDAAPGFSLVDLPELATPAEVAQVLRCSVRTVQSLCASGKIGACQPAGRYLMTRAAVAAYLEATKVTPCPNATPVPGLSGAKTGKSGKSSSTSGAPENADQRALRIATSLSSSSSSSSQFQVNPNPPVPLRPTIG